MKNPLLLLVLPLALLLQTSPLFAYSRIDCNFDSSSCSYTQKQGNSWTRTNNATVNPGHDHTSGSGFWLSTIPSSNYTGTQEFVVFSPYVYSTSGPSCLRFWFVFFGLEKAQFDVKINHNQNTFNAQTLWSKLTPVSNNWIQGYVDIPRQSSYFYVIWHATLTSKYHDTVGIDDITLSPGACPPSPLVDFESGMGSWTSQGAALTNGTPINDHTAQTYLGHYLLNKGGSQTSVVSASITNLTSTYTNNFYSYCFKLWYYFLFQPNTGDTQSYIFLNLTNYRYQYSKKLTVQDAYNDGLYNKWEPLYFSFPNPKRMARYKVDPRKDSLITITMYGKGATQIAVDDLLVSDNACETSGDCDFEKDFCGWSNVGHYLWLRSTGGNTKALTKSPPVDTTTKTAAGWYAVFPLEYIKAYDSATIQSPPLTSRNNYNCFSFNYYAVTTSEVYKVAAFYVNFYDITKFNQPIARVAVNASTYPMWQRFRYSLPKLPLRYSISISTAFSSGRIVSDLAIDDIVLNDYTCRGDRPGMITTTPIPYNERIWDCTFEYKCRQWNFDSNWKMTSYRKLPPSVPAPRSDHNRKSPEGGYLLFMPSISSQNMTTITSVLNSTIISDKPHCLSFWYYDSSELFFTLTVYLRTKTHTIILRTVRPNIATRSWKMVKADVWSYYNSQFVSLSLLTTTAANGSFAIDDIKLVPGSCKHIDDFVYTFDSLDDLEITRVSPLNGFMGTIHYQTDRTYPSAPTRDHTTGTGGYFLFMNRQTDFNTTYTDELVVDNLPAMRYAPELSNTRCFRFAYQVKGDASLKVYLSQINSNSFYYPIFSTYADHTNWVVAQVPYSAYYEHKLVFIMTKQWDVNSYVAIDDLSVSSHNCKRAVECDFDDDVCAYSSSYFKVDYDFSRYVGPPSNASWPGPAYDHTKRGYGGGYLSMTGFPSSQDRFRNSVVQTPIEIFPYAIPSNYCLSFWTTLTAPDATVTITMNLFGKTATGASISNTVNLVTLSNQTQNKWTWYSMDIDRKMFTNYHEFNLLFGGSTTKASTVIAIDDIALGRMSCDYGYRFKCADGTMIDATKMCNFKYDCPGNDHSDEANCGECDFENGACGWVNENRMGEYSSQGRWYAVRASGGYINSKTDGSGNANGHYLFLSNYLAKLFVAGTKLTRNYYDFKIQFKDAYFTCSMTFDYFISSNRTQYSAATLEVNAGSDSDSAVLKAYYFNKANSWQKGIVYLGGFPGSFVVTFLGSRFTVNESVALDNIHFHNCSFPNPIAPKANCPVSSEVMCQDSRVCIDPSDLCDFEDDCGTNWDERWSLCSPAANPKLPPSCAFEQSLEFCGFTMETSEKLFNWQFTKGYDYNVIGYSGPGADHTTKDRTGQFLMLKSYNKKYMHKNIRLYSPFMYSKGGACWLRFFYYNNGNVTLNSYNSLQVWVQYADGNNDDSSVLFRSNSYMAYWQKGKVKFSSGSPFRFVFDSQLADNRGSISLDDVSYSLNCVYSPKSKLTPGSHSHAAVTVILVLLSLAIVGGVGFFLYRKHKSGELTTYVDRVSSMMPGKKSSQMSHVVNVNYKDGPSTSAAE